MKKRIGINGTIIFLALVAAAVFWQRVLRPGGSFIDRFLEPCGFTLLLFGILLRISSRGFKSEQSANGHALVQGGPYELVRNPMYLGIFSIGLGAIMCFFQYWVAAVFLGFMFLRYLPLIRKEESILTERFGAHYKEYLTRVPRLIPYFKTLLNNPASALMPMRLGWIKKEISSIVPLFCVIAGIEVWRASQRCTKTLALYEIASYSAVCVLFVLVTVSLAKSYEKKPA